MPDDGRQQPDRRTPDRRKDQRGGLRLEDVYRMETGQPLRPRHIAKMTGFGYWQVMEEIRSGEIIAIKIQRKTRVRYLVPWENARAWMQRMGMFARFERLESIPPKPAA